MADIRTPFTPEQVKALNERQKDDTRHPYTCPNRGDGNHLDDGEGVLVATTAGWVCLWCDYRQIWAMP